MVDTWYTLGHESESNPSAGLVGVIGTRHSIEKQRKWIHSGPGNLAFSRTGWSQVP